MGTEDKLAVVVCSDESCFDLPEWRELLGGDAGHHVFATPEWNRLWWTERGEGKQLLVLQMTRRDETAAIVPLYRKEEGGRSVLRFVGGIDLTDYLGPICAPSERRLVAAELVAWLSGASSTWHELDAHNMPVPEGFAEFLVERADHAGFAFLLEQEQTAAVLVLPDDWDTYLASLGGKERHELRRKMRRLARDHPDATVRGATEDTLERDLATFIDLSRAQESKRHFMRPDVAGFFARVAHEFMARGWLRLDLLEIGERAVAATFGFARGDTFYLYNSAFEAQAGKLSPGLLLVAQLVRRSIEDGLGVFDFLRGPERYKYQLGAEPVPLNNLRVLNERS